MQQPRIPSLRRHKPSSQGVVTLNGHDIYLGSWPANKRKPPAPVQSKYDALIAEWLASGRVVANSKEAEKGQLTVAELLSSFWVHAEQHYRHSDGRPSHELADYRLSLRPVRHLYADLPVVEFGPLKLKAVRNLMMNGYVHPKYGPQPALSRKLINQRIGRVVRAFKWAVSEELVPVEVYQGLKSVRGLEKGRTEARETEPVAPVAITVVEATLPFLLPPLQAMVRLQLLTGMRPGEACAMRACDIDMTGDVWLYRPKEHKTAHRGKSRVIALGPKAQEIIREFLKLDTTAYLFSPREAVEAKNAARAAARTTPKSCGNRVGTNRKSKPKRKPGERYFTHAYGLAIKRAASKAGAPHWHPHQLRHSHGTEVRRKYGLEAAQVALGHSQANVTEIYAERDLTLAVKVAAEMG